MNFLEFKTQFVKVELIIVDVEPFKILTFKTQFVKVEPYSLLLNHINIYYLKPNSLR